jgi:FkbM family methyltransferase
MITEEPSHTLAKSESLARAFDHLLAVRQFLGDVGPSELSARFLAFCTANLLRSPAQLLQDLLVVFLLGGKRNGFFVEVGAANGIDFSNSFILERDFGWNGILVEPARGWHDMLKRNRRVKIDTHLVWSKTGERLRFRETEARELSTLDTLAEGDLNRNARARGTVYSVESITLNDLLHNHGAPAKIDYLSLDTEGSEYAILQSFNFNRYDIGIMTVEHAFREPERQEIYRLLVSNGFVRLFDTLSKFDDWYVKRSLLNR